MIHLIAKGTGTHKSQGRDVKWSKVRANAVVFSSRVLKDFDSVRTNSGQHPVQKHTHLHTTNVHKTNENM